ncbi:recombinase family protein [Actinomycetes bacterium NPDC127524]
MKRVWCLYRVSTKKQVNTDDDLPMQKNACRNFAEKMADWEITNELSEKGVSGWSKKGNQRDALKVIREGARNREFDVLLVFMFDRLGRREDETPMVVSFLNENGVEVWSVQEGKRNIESHNDKLMNYLSFWVSDNESHKTSIRVRESKKQLSSQGYFQGGTPPIGYKIYETEELHWKNKDRRKKELMIEEKESELIKIIFSLYTNRHMGYRKIVDYINSKGFRTRDGKLFGVSTVQRIVGNPIYTGRKRYKSFDGKMHEQPHNEKLRIIPDETFNQAQDIKNKRRQCMNQQDKEGIPLTGKLMFSGLAHCRYCGAKLSGNYLYRKQSKGDKETTAVIYRYKCPLNKGNINGQHACSIWGAKKYDNLILQQVKQILKLSSVHFIEEFSVNLRKKKERSNENNILMLEREERDGYKKLKNLHEEIARSLDGESMFTPLQLSQAIKGLEEKIKDSQKNISLLKSENDNGELINPEDWDTLFDEADDDLKKALFSKIIDKIFLAKEAVFIDFNVQFEKLILYKKEV